MKTDDLIKDLSSHLTPSPEGRALRTILVLWMLGSLFVLGLSLFILPIRFDLNDRILSFFFQSETTAIFIVFLTAAFVTYRSSLPGQLQRRDKVLGGIALSVFILMLLSKMSIHTVSAELFNELYMYRGWCGPTILGVALLEAVLVFTVARLGASTHPAVTAAWGSLSAGALGLFAMQFICFRENFMHVVVWHFTPVAILLVSGVYFGRRLLKW